MENKPEVLICACNSPEHQLLFFKVEDIEYDKTWKNIYIRVHLNKRPFWSRVKYAIAYIFGHQCSFGAFDEFIIDEDNYKQFKQIGEFFEDVTKQ